jgi:U3 small nucleolar RNA-associated protein 18
MWIIPLVSGACRHLALILPRCKHMATDSSSTGVINLYRTLDAKASSTPTPVKSFFHLTTTITTLRFHPDSQILAAGSSVKQDAFKLIHVPSLSVFQNWPTSNTPLGRVCAANFSADGSHIVIANDKGKVLLYRLLSYAG